MTSCICGADEPCTGKCKKHDRVLHGYPCNECQAEWEQANPRTAKAIGDFAEGKGSAATVAKARKADQCAT